MGSSLVGNPVLIMVALTNRLEGGTALFYAQIRSDAIVLALCSLPLQ
jgi:hypothetical protein